MANKKDKYIPNEDLFDADGKQIATTGEPTDKIPARSVGWLLEQGRIRREGDPAPQSESQE